MQTMTSAYVNKMLRSLEEDKAFWVNKEATSSTYVVAVDEEPVVPEYDYAEVAATIAGIDEKIKEFIKNIHVNVGEVVNFSSAALIESTYKQVKKEVEAKGLKMSEDEFHCRGAFKFVHRGKPDDNDLKNVGEFAKRIIN